MMMLNSGFAHQIAIAVGLVGVLAIASNCTSNDTAGSESLGEDSTTMTSLPDTTTQKSDESTDSSSTISSSVSSDVSDAMTQVSSASSEAMTSSSSNETSQTSSSNSDTMSSQSSSDSSDETTSSSDPCDLLEETDTEPTVCSEHAMMPADLTIHNRCTTTVLRLEWINYTCQADDQLWLVMPGQELLIHSFETHPWRIRDEKTGRLMRSLAPLDMSAQTFDVP